MIILSVGIGALLTSVAFTRQPHLAYILPFRVFRLTILDHCSGLQLFTHDWSLESNFFDPNLFSGMFQGLSGILRETLQKGFPREIYLEHAVVLLERSVCLPLTFVLIASKSSSLRCRALRSFTDTFSQQFGRIISSQKGIIATDSPSIERHVTSAFPLILNYVVLDLYLGAGAKT